MRSHLPHSRDRSLEIKKGDRNCPAAVIASCLHSPKVNQFIGAVLAMETVKRKQQQKTLFLIDSCFKSTLGSGLTVFRSVGNA